MSLAGTRNGDRIQPTPALIAGRGSPVSFGRALHDVEAAIVRHLHAPSWPSQVGQALNRLAVAVDRHIEATEHHGGLYDEIVERAPHLSHEIDGLREAHTTMREHVARCLERTTRGDDPTDIRSDARELLATLARHCQKGSDLVYETYCVDFGPLD